MQWKKAEEIGRSNLEINFFLKSMKYFCKTKKFSWIWRWKNVFNKKWHSLKFIIWKVKKEKISAKHKVCLFLVNFETMMLTKFSIPHFKFIFCVPVRRVKNCPFFSKNYFTGFNGEKNFSFVYSFKNFLEIKKKIGKNSIKHYNDHWWISWPKIEILVTISSLAQFHHLHSFITCTIKFALHYE